MLPRRRRAKYTHHNARVMLSQENEEKMSKKHFIALADYIRQHNNFETGDRFSQSQIRVLARFCKSQNFNFKEDRWLDYIDGKCGKNGGTVKAVRS